MYQATVFIKLQNFSGDAAGNLHGNYGFYASEADAAANKPAFSSIGVQGKLMTGIDPLATLDAALAARTDLPTLTEV
jgi:hypothetical protein